MNIYLEKFTEGKPTKYNILCMFFYLSFQIIKNTSFVYLRFSNKKTIRKIIEFMLIKNVNNRECRI